MSFLDRIRECAQFEPGRYVPFRAEGLTVGYIRRETVDLLGDYSSVFAVTEDAVSVVSTLSTVEERTARIAEVLAQLRADGHIDGWRDEPYPVGTRFSAEPLFTMERAAVPLFGVRGYGVHMNGWLKKGADMYMWVARRSLTKPTGPGKLDQMVAGGQPAGLSLMDNMIKECQEEAGIPREIAEAVQPVGTISYMTERPEGLRRDVLFNFDLQVPTTFTPRNEDGEVDEFMLWPIEDVINTVRDTDAFKFNCALVIIDFLVRRGLIEADHPEYTEIVEGLHRTEMTI